MCVRSFVCPESNYFFPKGNVGGGVTCRWTLHSVSKRLIPEVVLQSIQMVNKSQRKLLGTTTKFENCFFHNFWRISAVWEPLKPLLTIFPFRNTTIETVSRLIMVITPLLAVQTFRRVVFDNKVRHTSTLTLGEALIWCSSSISIRLRVDFEEKYNYRKRFAPVHGDNITSSTPDFQESCFW